MLPGNSTREGTTQQAVAPAAPAVRTAWRRCKPPAANFSAMQALYESLREKVFIAERALLYALDFDFAVQHAAKVGLPQGWSCAVPAPQLTAAAREEAGIAAAGHGRLDGGRATAQAGVARPSKAAGSTQLACCCCCAPPACPCSP